MELTFAILGFVFGMMGFAEASVCLVKMHKMEKSLKEKGILEENYK